MTHKKYQESHPWITFELNLRKAPSSFWMLLGAAESKCFHLAGTPLLPETAKKLYRVYLAKGALGTTAIEGNTLSEEEVNRLLEGELKLPPSRQYLEQEVKNVIEACNNIADEVIPSDFSDICLNEIKQYNKQILKGLKPGKDVIPGKFRTGSVVVASYRGAPAEDCPYLVERLCKWINSEFISHDNPILGKNHVIASGILAAIVTHLYFVWVHPFDDGNGRTARLLEFRLLLETGTPAPAAHLLSNFYNQTRTEYYRQLNVTSRTPDGATDFIEYALQGLVDSLDEQIEVVRAQQLRALWTNYIHEKFRGKNSKADIRRRNLILAMSAEQQETIDIKDLDGLTPVIAKDYAGKTRKTLIRDLNILEEMGLLKREKGKARVLSDIVSSFLPRRKA